MASWKTRMTPHRKADGSPCDGVFRWGKDTLWLSARTTIRRECPLCGFRQKFNPRMKQWLSHGHNPRPGAGRWAEDRYGS